MKIETYTRGIYQILKIDGQPLLSDISELRDLICGYLQRGIVNIAVSFCDASYIYSGAITILIDCYKKVKAKNGTLCILEPDQGLFEILDMLNITKVITVCNSEESLPKAQFRE